MKKTIDAFIGIVGTMHVPFAIAIVLVASFVPWVMSSTSPYSLGSGVVLETVDAGDQVVLLESGVHAAVEGSKANPGDTVEVYNAKFAPSPTVGDGAQPMVVVVFFVLFAAGFLSSFVIAMIGALILDSVDFFMKRKTSK